ncbi:MAG TPA: TRAP transporter small permease subunit [Pseudomonas sp.]|jgi:TRAP-type mannitol/chloroaromatic compound transport system permease small subunit|nr:TRAP transporter small permease subunit [Pseudomonas sp.]
MPRAIRIFVRSVDAITRFVGRCTMYLIFAIIGVLFYSVFSKSFADPAIWTLELAQFLMVAYFLLGGAYALQQGDHVRMDLFYSRWSPRKRALIDLATVGLLLIYLGFLLYGGISSSLYALEYNETSYSAWSPRMAPIKFIMCLGVLLMLLQVLATFFKDLATARGETL